MQILVGDIPIELPTEESDGFLVGTDEKKYENCPNLERREERRVEELEECPRLEGQAERREEELEASTDSDIKQLPIRLPDSLLLQIFGRLSPESFCHLSPVLWKDACVRAEDINSYFPGCIYECKNCGRQSRTLQALRGCNGSILIKLQRMMDGHGSRMNSLPARARPDCLPWPHSCDPTQKVSPVEGRSRMRGEFDYLTTLDYLAPVDRAIDTVEEGEICHLQARDYRSLWLHGNDFGEGTSRMYSPISHGAYPSGKSHGLNHEHARSIPLQGGRLSLDGTAKLTESHSNCETWDPHFPQARRGHGPNHLELTLIIGDDESGLNRGKARPPTSPKYDGPTTSNVSSEGMSTMLNPGSSSEVIVLAREEGDIEIGGTPFLDQVQGGQAPMFWGDSSSHGSAHENRDMEMGGTHTSDHLPGESGSVDICPYHVAREDNWERLTTMVDPLLAVIFQGVCSLLAYKSSDGLLARNVLFYVLVFDCMLGFLFVLGGKWFRCAKMKAIGLLAAALGFLMTMALVIIYKIG